MKNKLLLILLFVSTIVFSQTTTTPVGSIKHNNALVLNNSADTLLVRNPTTKMIEGVSKSSLTENSAGALSGFAITNNGNGTINLASGVALLRTTNSPTGLLKKYNISAITNIALTDNANNFLLVDYNSGSPTITVTTNTATINTTTNSLIGVVARVGTTLHYLSLVGQNVDANAKLRIRFLNSEVLRRAQGAVIGSVNRNLTLTAGLFYSGLIPVTTQAFNTVTPDTFTLAYNNGSVWTRTTGQTQVNNTQYNNSGTLTNFGGGNNHFRTDYIYLLANNPSKLYVIMGDVDYSSLGSAVLAPTPAILPVELQSLGILVGQVVIQKNATTMQANTSFGTTFTGSTVNNHNDLAGLNIDPYLHLTAVEKTSFNDGLNGAYGRGLSPTITTTTPRGAVTIQRGSASDSDDVLIIKNGAGVNTSSTDGSGTLKIGNTSSNSGNAIKISKKVTVLNSHIIDDYSLLEPTVGGDGFGVVDLSTEMRGGVSNDHFNGFQSRLNYSSSANLLAGTFSAMQGLLVRNSITGTGIVSNAHGIRVDNILGSGTVLNQKGIYVEPQIKGTISNYDIYAPGFRSLFGKLSVGNLSTSYSLNVDSGTNIISSFFKGSFLTGNKNYSSILVGVDSSLNKSIQFGYSYDNATPLNSYAYITPFGGLEGMQFAISLGGRTMLGSNIDDGVNRLQVSGTAKFTGTVSGAGATAPTHFVTKSQSDLKADLASPTFTTGITTPAINLSGATASRAVVTDASKNLVSSSVTSTELALLSGKTAIPQLTQTVTNGVTASSPSEDAVYDFVQANIATSGSYSPTITNIANTSSLSAKATYTKTGNIVCVYVRFGLTEIAGSTYTQFRVTLPINRTTSNLVNSIGSGVVIGNGLDNISRVSFDTANNSTAVITYKTAGSYGSTFGTINFQYQTTE